MENRNGIVIDLRVGQATGRAERDARRFAASLSFPLAALLQLGDRGSSQSVALWEFSIKSTKRSQITKENQRLSKNGWASRRTAIGPP